MEAPGFFPHRGRYQLTSTPAFSRHARTDFSGIADPQRLRDHALENNNSWRVIVIEVKIRNHLPNYTLITLNKNQGPPNLPATQHGVFCEATTDIKLDTRQMGPAL